MMSQPSHEGGDLMPINDQRVELESIYTQQEMAARLGDMRAKLSIVQSFFKEVMVKGQDYGIIPGTDKPTLYKAGSEKLCELYGFSITIKDLQETVDQITGYYRVIVTVALTHRRTGIVVAEGVGEANTNEGRYRWRWLPDGSCRGGSIRMISYLKSARVRRASSRYTVSRTKTPWALWNTILKMAKKRALVDATLSATRSSGLFTQDLEDLEEWAEAGHLPDEAAVTPEQPSATATAPPARGEKKDTGKPEQQRQTRGSRKQQPAAEQTTQDNGKQQNGVNESDDSLIQQYRNRINELGLTREEVASFMKERFGWAPGKNLTGCQIRAFLDAYPSPAPPAEPEISLPPWELEDLQAEDNGAGEDPFGEDPNLETLINEDGQRRCPGIKGGIPGYPR